MNECARKKARRAELEYKLLGVYFLCKKYSDSFAVWLECQAGFITGMFEDAAKELIALYEGDM